MQKKGPKRVFRSKQDRVISGVCGGIAEYFNIDPVWIRIIAVVLAIMEGVGIVLYVIAWIIIPENPGQKQNRNRSQSHINQTFKDFEKRPAKNKASIIIGLTLLLLGFAFLFDEIFFWFSFKYIWPLIIIGAGVYILLKVKK